MCVDEADEELWEGRVSSTAMYDSLCSCWERDCDCGKAVDEVEAEEPGDDESGGVGKREAVVRESAVANAISRSLLCCDSLEIGDLVVDDNTGVRDGRARRDVGLEEEECRAAGSREWLSDRYRGSWDCWCCCDWG